MKIERILIVPDTHAPYHDKRAWDIVMQVGRAIQPDTIVHLGDLADFYAVSAYSKSPLRTLSLPDEVEICRSLRLQLDSLAPKRKIFIEGNHEDRLRRYLTDKAPELFGLVNTDQLLQLSENDWEFYPYREHAKIGKVYFTHDTGHAGKYATNRSLETYQHSVVVGHNHANQYLVTGDATGTYQVGAQFGWLGDMNQIDYLHRIKVSRQWSLGFGTGYHEVATGVIWLTPHPIVNYSVCVDGKVYRCRKKNP